MKKDEALKDLSSSSGVEDAFQGLTQSLKESRQKYDEDKGEWEKKLAASKAEKVQLGNKVKDLERENKKYSEKLTTFVELKNKLKSAEEELTLLHEANRQKEELEAKLKASEDLLSEKLSSKKTKRKKAIKKSFSTGWDKGWNKGVAAMMTQVQYGSLKYFRDGWVAALQELKVSEDSELFQ